MKRREPLVRTLSNTPPAINEELAAARAALHEQADDAFRVLRHAHRLNGQPQNLGRCLNTGRPVEASPLSQTIVYCSLQAGHDGPCVFKQPTQGGL